MSFSSDRLNPNPPQLGFSDVIFSDLFLPEKLAQLQSTFEVFFRARAPEEFRRYEAFRMAKEYGDSPQETSTILLLVAPHVEAFLARLFKIESFVDEQYHEVKKRHILWEFNKEFVKKRIAKLPSHAESQAGKEWRNASFTRQQAELLTQALLKEAKRRLAFQDDALGEELLVAKTVLTIFRLHDAYRKANKNGGIYFDDAQKEEARVWFLSLFQEGASLDFLRSQKHLSDHLRAVDLGSGEVFSYEWVEPIFTLILDAFEFLLAVRLSDPKDVVCTWSSLKTAGAVDASNLVQLRRPKSDLPEWLTHPPEKKRERIGFSLTDVGVDSAHAEREVDYCLYCHERQKDSCSKGLRDNKSGELKTNSCGATLHGCPLGEKISEAHVLRRNGLSLAALALIMVDNPMCPGTGHRICNDCMKACIFQKQDPVNIPQVETHILNEVLKLPWGVEIYGLLTRWNPLDLKRPYPLVYNGKNVLVVGLGPAGYTLSHYLSREGFGVVAVDGLKLEPLPDQLIGRGGKSVVAVERYEDLLEDLNERTILGFGGVSEYGITVRWDKNFLKLLYLTLSRHPHIRFFGGVRFGGTFTLDDAWTMGFDHVAMAAGAGKPTIIDFKNNLAPGIRKASDFLMGLQLSGAYKADNMANLQVELPAIVIGGGLTAIDTATELIAYYQVQIEKLYARYTVLASENGEASVLETFNKDERKILAIQLAHAKEWAAEKEAAKKENREAEFQKWMAKWGGVSLTYRKSIKDSPAYRLNHEEVQKSLEEGVQYIENLSPVEATLDDSGHVDGVIFQRLNGEKMRLSARTVCVAAGTSPNVTYEKEYPESFLMDTRGQYFQAHVIDKTRSGKLELKAISDSGKGDESSEAFFTSYEKGGRLVSFFGDNHPYYAGSVVKAMASAKRGYKHIARLFEEDHDSSEVPLREKKKKDLFDLFGRMEGLFRTEVVAVNRLTDSIVEVVIFAPLAASKFKPGQFFRLQNYERSAQTFEGTKLLMEGLALTGAWADPEKGQIGVVALELGASSRLCATLKPGEPVVLMGPTGAPTEIAAKETVLLCGGGLGNAVLLSIAKAFKAESSKVIYFAAYKNGADLFKREEIEASADQVIWCTDFGSEISPHRKQDLHFRGNIVQAMVAYAKGELSANYIHMREVSRILAIGSDRMMEAVKDARHGELAPFLNPKHLAIASVNSPMQCMMKEICAQCLQKHHDPVTNREWVVFTCFNQDQPLDHVDFSHLRGRLKANSMQEKLTSLWLSRLFKKHPELHKI